MYLLYYSSTKQYPLHCCVKGLLMEMLPLSVLGISKWFLLAFCLVLNLEFSLNCYHCANNLFVCIIISLQDLSP